MVAVAYAVSVVVVVVTTVTVVDTGAASTLHALVTSEGANVARTLGSPVMVLDVVVEFAADESSCRRLKGSAVVPGAAVTIPLLRLP